MTDSATLQRPEFSDRSSLQDTGVWNRRPPHKATAVPVDESVQAFLRARTFLGRFSEAAFAALIARAQVKTFETGDVICHRQDCGEALMIVVSGWIKIATSNVDGREIVLDFVGPGHISGEVSVLDGLERTADAIALDTAEVCLVPARDLRPLLEAHPEALASIVQGLCRKLRAASAMIEDHALDVRRRVARGIAGLVGKHGRRCKQGVYLGVEISQTELSSYLGMSRENINRELGFLRGAGIITDDRNRIIVTDESGLRAIAEATAKVRGGGSSYGGAS